MIVKKKKKENLHFYQAVVEFTIEAPELSDKEKKERAVNIAKTYLGFGSSNEALLTLPPSIKDPIFQKVKKGPIRSDMFEYALLDVER